MPPVAGVRCQFTLAQRNFCFKTHQRLKGRGYQWYEALKNEYEAKVSWQKSSNSRCHFKNGEEARSKFHFKQLELEELTRKHPFRKEKVNLHRHQPTHATLNTPMPPKTLPHHPKPSRTAPNPPMLPQTLPHHPKPSHTAPNPPTPAKTLPCWPKPSHAKPNPPTPQIVNHLN